jgi:Fe2+ transport system protein FeoA
VAVDHELAEGNSTNGRRHPLRGFPLTRVKAGVAFRIRQLCASPELQNRLRELDLGEDQFIRLLTSKSNFICQVCNARLAISQQLAQSIMVEPLKPALN